MKVRDDDQREHVNTPKAKYTTNIAKLAESNFYLDRDGLFSLKVMKLSLKVHQSEFCSKIPIDGFYRAILRIH